jgi:hypothetical protein
MARIRTVKPEFWQDEDLAALNPYTQLLAIGLLNHADDHGYFKAHKALVKAAVFPFSESSLNIHGMLTELSNIEYIELFQGTDGKPYGFVSGFSKHQKVNRPTPSKIGPLRSFTEDSLSIHGGLTGGTGNREQGKEQGTGSVREAELNSNSGDQDQNQNAHTTQEEFSAENKIDQVPEHHDHASGIIEGELVDQQALAEPDIFKRSVQSSAHTTGGQVVNFKRAAAETQMTTDWQPDEHIMVQLHQKAIPEDFIAEVRQNFMNHHIEKSGTSNTWSSRFSTWVKKDWAEKSHSWQQQRNNSENHASGSAARERLTDTNW